MSSTFKTVILWVMLVAVAVVLWRIIQSGPNGGKDQEIPYSDFMAQLAQNQVADATIEGNVVRGRLRNGSSYHAIVMATNLEFLKELTAHKDIKIAIKDNPGWKWSIF